jgi:endonuclease YncB( thermonuclease family)
MMSSLQPCVARLKALARVVDGDTLDLTSELLERGHARPYTP